MMGWPKEERTNLTVSYILEDGMKPMLWVSALGLDGKPVVTQCFYGDKAEDIFKKLMGEDDE